MRATIKQNTNTQELQKQIKDLQNLDALKHGRMEELEEKMEKMEKKMEELEKEREEEGEEESEKEDDEARSKTKPNK